MADGDARLCRDLDRVVALFDGRGGDGGEDGEEMPCTFAELGKNARKTWMGALLSAGCVTVGEDPDRPVDPGSEEALKKWREKKYFEGYKIDEEFIKKMAECDRLFEDPVNHPPHYTAHPSGVECIQVTEHMNFCLGNVVKYVWRADRKGDALCDLKKARWYLEREIARREKACQEK